VSIQKNAEELLHNFTARRGGLENRPTMGKREVGKEESRKGAKMGTELRA